MKWGIVRYEILIEGILDEHWSAWLDGLGIESDGGETIISGALPDQSALCGLLDKLRDLGLPLISVRRLLLKEQEAGSDEAHPPRDRMAGLVLRRGAPVASPLCVW
jgi:hypothetical protein